MKQIIVEIFSPKSRAWAGVAGLIILYGYNKLITDTPYDELIIGTILTLSGFIIFRQIFCSVMIVRGDGDYFQDRRSRVSGVSRGSYELRQGKKRGFFARILGKKDDSYVEADSAKDDHDKIEDDGYYNEDSSEKRDGYRRAYHRKSEERYSRQVDFDTDDYEEIEDEDHERPSRLSMVGPGLASVGRRTRELAGSTLDLVGRGTGATFTHLGSGLYKLGKRTRDISGSTLSLFGRGTGASIRHLGSGIYKIGQRTRDFSGSTFSLLGSGTSSITNGLMALSWGLAKFGRRGGYVMLNAHQAFLYQLLVFFQQHGYLLVMVALMASGFLDLAGADVFKTTRVFFIMLMINRVAEEYQKRTSLSNKIAIEVKAHVPVH